MHRRSGDSIGHCFLCRLPDNHREILYSRTLYTPDCLCVLGLLVHFFVQGGGGGKGRNPPPWLGLSFHYETLCRPLSRPCERRPASVWSNYAMIARQMDSPCCLIRNGSA